jgi:anti-sigma-K factor RskA
MTETDDNLTPEESRRVLPAEYVLGVLGAAERREFAARLEREPDLVREVAFWEERLGGLADNVRPIAPPPGAWSRIENALASPAPPASAPQSIASQSAASPPAASQTTTPSHGGLWQSLAFWRGFGMSAAAVAAASIVALAYVGIKPAPITHNPMLATLGQNSGQPAFVAALGSDGHSLVIVPASLLTADQRSMELWLIPAGDRPHSLGLISPGQPVRLNVPPNLVSRVNTETTLAVSLEPLGGSPTGQPTGPVVASGKLTDL